MPHRLSDASVAFEGSAFAALAPQSKTGTASPHPIAVLNQRGNDGHWRLRANFDCTSAVGVTADTPQATPPSSHLSKWRLPMRILNLLAISAISLATTAPAFAEADMMNAGAHPTTMMHMSASDTRNMKRCNAISHQRMMRSATCRRLAQMHPDMMHHDSKMQAPAVMPSDNKM